MADPFASLTPRARTALAEHLAALHHDLGKYVSLQVRWSNGDPSTLRDALTADLLATRRGPTGTADAAAVWDGFAPELRGERPLVSGDRVDLRGDEGYDRLEAAMAEVGRTIAALRDGGPDDAGLRAGADAARIVAEQCRLLRRRADKE